ncbi:hypothetical protein COLO4_14801 [Corchorus olitorius]|uniref:Uncharacterized protein n=1 Tax=Corchorus olitorius TaxID=93759 RepID=A0A1R3JQT4_9ROSI|nr:hypothetical protein COLO4_14801 [Corchorus olitorius]
MQDLVAKDGRRAYYYLYQYDIDNAPLDPQGNPVINYRQIAYAEHLEQEEKLQKLRKELEDAPTNNIWRSQGVTDEYYRVEVLPDKVESLTKEIAEAERRLATLKEKSKEEFARGHI